MISFIIFQLNHKIKGNIIYIYNIKSTSFLCLQNLKEIFINNKSNNNIYNEKIISMNIENDINNIFIFRI